MDGSRPRGAQRLGQLRRAVGLTQIGGNHVRPRMTGAGDLVGERGKLRLAPRGQRQRVAMLGENARERRADAGGSAGDQAHGLQGWALHG